MSETFDQITQTVIDDSSIPSDYQQQIKYDIQLNDILTKSLPENPITNFILSDIFSTWKNDALTYGGSVDGNQYDEDLIEGLNYDEILQQVLDNIDGDDSTGNLINDVANHANNIINEKDLEVNPDKKGVTTEEKNEMEGVLGFVGNDSPESVEGNYGNQVIPDAETSEFGTDDMYSDSKPLRNEDGSIVGESGRIYDGQVFRNKSRDIDWDKQGHWDNTLEDYQKYANQWNHPAYTSKMAGVRMWAVHPADVDKHKENPEDPSIRWQYRMYSDDGSSYQVPVDRAGNLDTSTYPFEHTKTYTTHSTGGSNYIDTSTGLEYNANYPLTKSIGGPDYYTGKKDGKYWSQWDMDWSNDYADMIGRPGNTFGLQKPTFASPSGEFVTFLASLVGTKGLAPMIGAKTILSKGGQALYNYGIRPLIINEGIALGTEMLGGEDYTINPLGMIYEGITGAPLEYHIPANTNAIQYHENQLTEEGDIPPWLKFDDEISNLFNELSIANPEEYGNYSGYKHQTQYLGGGAYDYSLNIPGIQTKDEVVNVLLDAINNGGN